MHLNLHVKTKAAAQVVGFLLSLEAALEASGIGIPATIAAIANAVLPLLASYLTPVKNGTPA